MKKFNRLRKQRFKTDPNYKIKVNLRSRFYHALKGNFKRQKTLDLLGCSIEELRQHLEAQFLPGMSWSNHTTHGWHIDHKKPCNSFDLTKESEQLKCFNFKNLQPLWAIDNWKKGNRI